MSKNKKDNKTEDVADPVDPATQVRVWSRVNGKLVGYDVNGNVVVGELPKQEAESSGGDSSESS